MDDMPRPRPPYLHRKRHATANLSGSPPRREANAAPAEYGTPEFEAEYQAALSSAQRRQKEEQAAGTLGWLVNRYRETRAWTGLSRQHGGNERTYSGSLGLAGNKPVVHDHDGEHCGGRAVA